MLNPNLAAQYLGTETIGEAQRLLRSNVRNFLMTATRAELFRELQISFQKTDLTRAATICELIEENGFDNGINSK